MSTFTSVQAQSTTPAASPNPPKYGQPGPYAVGKSWFAVDKGTDKPLLLVAWYPALKQAGVQGRVSVSVPTDYQVANMKTMGSMRGWGAATPWAMPDTTAAPYPLVVFSPGFAGSAMNYLSIEEHLASYGLVILAPALSMDGTGWESYIARPRLTSRELDFAEKLNSQDGSFNGLIDTKHIGVAGHSSGGYSAVAAAGAQFNYQWFVNNICIPHVADGVTIQQDCADMASHTADLLALAKLSSMPASVWPTWGDTRVTAIVSLAGSGDVFGPAGLASITIPVMVETGAEDNYVPPKWNADLIYDNISSAQKSEVVFESGNHSIFVDGYTTPASTYDQINHFTTAFLLDTLKGDKDAHKALLPDAVKFTGIEYKTTMK